MTPQRPFKSEAKLQEQLSRRLVVPRVGKAIHLQRRHVPVGECVPDFVVVRFATSPPTDLWPRRWSFRHSHVCWLLRTKGRLTASTIARLSYESVPAQRRILSDLLRCRAIKCHQDFSYSLSPRLQHMRTTVIAVEVKLSRWREALAQARGYKRFADQVMVVLDGNLPLPPASARRAFRNAKVGLQLATRGTSTWLVPLSRPRVARSSEREYLVVAAGLSPRPHTPWVSR